MSPSPSIIEALIRWASLKKYRIEVTYGVYVYTPVEKAVFWTIFCFLFAAISFAAIFYTERNVILLLRYASIYVGGEGGVVNVVSNLLPKSNALFTMAGSGLTSVAQTMSTAVNSQTP
ncbi:hypothetical protein F4813DRAFT_356303 [Daldinia decipiens]|uniref:uncharacterized protein n=1 Tax=Daldinia decipiens TaxID=326647 RepID=UPI0020C3EAC5|nr:uncharacterized protein F4813DRAFT_356303 [Daldinia decipiens]KAI1658801.1 hypothetical protein F4813DRAFT_356303 [Daldinia decipiens]